MDNERGNFQLPEYVPAIAATVYRLPVACRRLGIGRGTLKLVEVRDQFRVRIVLEKVTCEQLTKRRCITSPAFTN